MSPSSADLLTLRKLPQNAETTRVLTPDAEALAGLAQDLDLDALRKLRFEVTLTPRGKEWLLSGHLGATVVQPCRVTLAPVTTRIEEAVQRRYSPAFSLSADTEAEMPEDDTLEPLPEQIDLAQVMAEALALAIPPFPRAEDAQDLNISAAPPGVAPLTDEAAKPFAGLAELRAKMGDEDPQ